MRTPEKAARLSLNSFVRTLANYILQKRLGQFRSTHVNLREAALIQSDAGQNTSREVGPVERYALEFDGIHRGRLGGRHDSKVDREVRRVRVAGRLRAQVMRLLDRCPAG